MKSCVLTDMSGATCRFLFLLDPSELGDDELLVSEAWHHRSCSAVPLASFSSLPERESNDIWICVVIAVCIWDSNDWISG